MTRKRWLGTAEGASILTVVELTGKAHAGKPADPGLLARLAKETDFLLTAAGD